MNRADLLDRLLEIGHLPDTLATSHAHDLGRLSPLEATELRRELLEPDERRFTRAEVDVLIRIDRTLQTYADLPESVSGQDPAGWAIEILDLALELPIEAPA